MLNRTSNTGSVTKGWKSYPSNLPDHLCEQLKRRRKTVGAHGVETRGGVNAVRRPSFELHADWLLPRRDFLPETVHLVESFPGQIEI